MNHFPHRDRRRFLSQTVAGSMAIGAGALVGSPRVHGQETGEGSTASRAVRLGIIGVNNRGRANLRGVAQQSSVPVEIAAICDVDSKYLTDCAMQFPDATTFRDYRKMIDQQKNLDAVVISTPDHHHAPAAMLAIQQGLHVYCEKPLTHTVAEARALTIAAAKRKTITQMGTQIHATENYRRVVEKIRAGAVGNVGEVHVWVGKGWGATELPNPSGTAPPHVDWDLWLGPAKQREYTPGMHPANWRR